MAIMRNKSPDGDITEYAYDAAGRLVKEGEKTYEYGWLDKVIRVAEGEKEFARLNTTTIISLQEPYAKAASKPSNGTAWRLLSVAAQNTLTNRTPAAETPFL